MNKNIPIEFFEKYIDKSSWAKCVLCGCTINPKQLIEKYPNYIHWQSLCQNPNLSFEFFEKNLDKVKWASLCLNTNIPSEFFEKHLYEVFPYELSLNTNISIEFFENHLDKINWHALSYNNFSEYLSNIEKKENKQKMAKVFFEINSTNSFPSNISSCLPKGGREYLEMLSKYA